MPIRINFFEERLARFRRFSREDIADRWKKGIFHRRFWSFRKRTRISLRNGEMFCSFDRETLDVWHWSTWKRRHIDVAELIAEAIPRLCVGKIPPFFVSLRDRPLRNSRRHHTRFAQCTADGSPDVAAPDFVFGGWPEAQFDDFDAKTVSITAASAIPARDDRAGWCGRNNTPWREKLFELAGARPDLIDARDTMAGYDEVAHVYRDGFVPMENQAADYRYLIDIEGNGYSGRLKLLLHAQRVVFLQAYPWQEWFMPLMQPYRHYVPVKRDLSDLIDRIEWLRQHPEVEAEIIREAQLFARTWLTRATAIAEWARLLEKHVAAGGRLSSGLEDRSPPDLQPQILAVQELGRS